MHVESFIAAVATALHRFPQAVAVITNQNWIAPRQRIVAAGVIVALWLCIEPVSAVDFSNDVEPIFTAHCIDCHGPDEQNGEFRLDRLSTMLRGGNSGEPAIVPHDPTASYLLKLIRHQEPGMEMPPDGSLDVEEIKRIETWIAEGATTPESYGPAAPTIDLSHWSFQPLSRPRSGGNIDDLVRRKLHERDLHPSAQADRQVLIRRLFLVMLGLPPTPEQVDSFVNDGNEHAWNHLVERVLASPHYGQRWATHWLDLVRFGETNGFETNRERPHAWRYRDWVIESLNEDKPYDDFVREQIAGDALDADVATGFLVAGPYDLVKGQNPELQLIQRMNELDDMINATGTAFLGLTTGCARCHNHKFDPISQRDYYSLQAVFAGVEHGDRPLPATDETERRLAKLDAEIVKLQRQLGKFLFGSKFGTDRVDESDSTATPAARPAVNAIRNEERFSARLAKLVRFTIEQSSSGEACIDELEIFAGDLNVALAAAGATATSSGDFQHPLHKLQHINDGQYGNAHSWIVDSTQGGWVQIELPRAIEIDRIVWGRDREGRYADRLAVAYRIEAATEPGRWELLASSKDRLDKRIAVPTGDNYHFANFPAAEALQGRKWLLDLEVARDERTKLRKAKLAYAGKFSQPGPTHRLYRGEPSAKREQVPPDAIEAFTTLQLDRDAPEQQRRLALANWIASDRNPLTARVIVNRLWQFHFGTGIVDTPSDFGRNGSLPSHPELIDFLAAELIENGWSLKHIHRLILKSQTWQQSHHPNPQAMAVDAETRLLWRFPPRRLEAEAIRDSILLASGTIDLGSAGGPGFSAFAVQMENVRHYHPKQSYSREDWRRMIYMTKVRQEKDVVFGAFDCPDASMVVSQRSRSTTPLQALNLLNSRFIMQQAEQFAMRLKSEFPTSVEQIQRGWQLCYQRAPSESELIDSQLFIEQQGLEQFTRALLNTNEFVFIP